MTPNTEGARTFYGRWARVYDFLARRTPGIAALRRRAAILCRLEPGDTVVEMGCGTGANLPFLREEVGSDGTVVGIDFTARALERAQRVTAQYDNVHLVRADATTPPVATEPDAILATFVLGMLSRPGETVDDWCNLVGSDGRVALVDAARSRTWYALPVNALFRIVVVLSTPPTAKLRYEVNLHRQLEERIETGHERLRERAIDVDDRTHVAGIVRLLGGSIGRS